MSVVLFHFISFSGSGQTVGHMLWAMKERITPRMSNIPGDWSCPLVFPFTSTGTLALEVHGQIKPSLLHADTVFISVNHSEFYI